MLGNASSSTPSQTTLVPEYETPARVRADLNHKHCKFDISGSPTIIDQWDQFLKHWIMSTFTGVKPVEKGKSSTGSGGITLDFKFESAGTPKNIAQVLGKKGFTVVGKKAGGFLGITLETQTPEATLKELKL